MNLKEELALVARAQAGDKDALGALWDGITPILYGYLANRLRNKELAEDILQETWLKAIAKIGQFQPRGVKFSAWLFAIARNECKQHWRGSHVDLPLEENTKADAPVKDNSVENALEVEMALKNLSEGEREILRLRYISDLSFKDIAAVLKISPISARVRAHRALNRARVELINDSL